MTVKDGGIARDGRNSIDGIILKGKRGKKKFSLATLA